MHDKKENASGENKVTLPTERANKVRNLYNVSFNLYSVSFSTQT